TLGALVVPPPATLAVGADSTVALRLVPVLDGGDERVDRLIQVNCDAAGPPLGAVGVRQRPEHRVDQVVVPVWSSFSHRRPSRMAVDSHPAAAQPNEYQSSNVGSVL